MPCVSEARNNLGDPTYALRTGGRPASDLALSVVREIEFFRQLFRETLTSSKFLERQRHFELLEETLLRVSSLARGWDSYDSEPPSFRATGLAADFLRKLYDGPFLPSSIVPSAEGGTALYFVRGNKNAYAEFRNSGELIVALYDDKMEPIVIELSPTDADETRAIELLRKYLS